MLKLRLFALHAQSIWSNIVKLTQILLPAVLVLTALTSAIAAQPAEAQSYIGRDRTRVIGPVSSQTYPCYRNRRAGFRRTPLIGIDRHRDLRFSRRRRFSRHRRFSRFDRGGSTIIVRF